MKKIISFIILAVFAVACTDNFADMNSNPYRITEKSLDQNFNSIGSVFAGMLGGLQGNQTQENLMFDDFVRHMGTNTPFMSNRNNTTYYVTYNDFWARIYDNVMAPSFNVMKKAETMGFPDFVAMIKLLRLLGIQKLTCYFGPVVYTNYGASGASTVYYDSEPDLYNALFKTLDEVYDVFSKDLENNRMVKFDASYNGDLNKWMKLINSVRLRLAIRISKADPVLAQTQGEKAMKDPHGLILTNEDNFNTSLYGSLMPMAQICYSWNDTRMGAGMEEVLLGYKDPRLEKWFAPIPPQYDTLYADHPSQPYKGVASGSYIATKDERMNFSKVAAHFQSATIRRFLTAAEVHFALAEAKLRKWDTGMPESVQDHYENGVRVSFADWGAAGVDTYLADGTSKPIDYVDPIDKWKKANEQNSYKTRNTVTIKWDESATDEEKLERIMVQKWLASFTNACETWSDHRRTGYPKLHYVPKNDSSPQWGVIPADGFPWRWVYPDAERLNNAAAVADATKKLGGNGDMISTRLWIHPDKSNF